MCFTNTHLLFNICHDVMDSHKSVDVHIFIREPREPSSCDGDREISDEAMRLHRSGSRDATNMVSERVELYLLCHEVKALVYRVSNHLFG